MTVARRATSGLLLAIGLALLVAALAARKLLSPRAESRAHAPQPSQPPAVGSLPDDSAGAANAGAGVSDLERILAWVARHKGSVSFDPVEWFLEDTPGKLTWHEGAGEMPDGEVVAVNFFREGIQEALADIPDGATVPVLKLPREALTPSGAVHLTRIRGLRGLYLHQEIGDDVVALGDLHELEWLLIHGEEVTDRSLVHLGRLTALRHLGLIGIGIRGESGASSQLPATLEVLFVFTRRGLHDSFVTAMPPLPNLRELHLRETDITDAALPKIGTFRALLEIDLGNNCISDAGVAHLKDLLQLESLDLAGSPITDEGFATIAKLAGLVRLSLRGTDVEALPGVESLTHLRSLDLESTPLTDDALERLMPLKQLEGLDLSRTTGITDRGLGFVGALSGLQSLNLEETRVTNVGIGHLGGLPRIEELRLDRTSVNDAGLAQLAGLRSLRALYLRDTGVTVEGLFRLRDLPNLRFVDTRLIGPADRERLTVAMPHCTFE